MLPNELEIEMPAKPQCSISRAASSAARRRPGSAIRLRAGNCVGIGLTSSPGDRRSYPAMSKFCDDAWAGTAELRAAIHRLPFNVELAAGTLARERFRFYIQQDAIYLGQFARVLAIAAAKAPNTATLQNFAQSALVAITVEQALHERYLKEFGVDPADTARAEAAPDCFAYTSFLTAVAYNEPWEVLVAALLPCFRIYWDVGCAIASTAAA